MTLGEASVAPPETHRKRPGWVWAITIFYVLSGVWTILVFALVQSGAFLLNAEQQRYFAGFGLLGYVLAVGLPLLAISAGVALFLLRRVAVPLFGAALTCDVASMLWAAVTADWVQVQQRDRASFMGSSIGVVIHIALQLVVIEYTTRLRSRGVLT